MLYHKLLLQFIFPEWCLHEIVVLYQQTQTVLLQVDKYVYCYAKKTCLFMELNAFSVSISKTASVSFVENMSCIKSTAASHPAYCPPHSSKF